MKDTIKTLAWGLLVALPLLPIWLPLAALFIAWRIARNVEEAAFE